MRMVWPISFLSAAQRGRVSR